MSDQVWPWILVIAIVVLVGVVALLVRRRSTGGEPAEPSTGAPQPAAPVGPEAAGAVTAPDVTTPGPAGADPDAVTAGPVPAATSGDDPADAHADEPTEPPAAPTGSALEEPDTARPAAAADSALAALDAGRVGGVAAPRRSASAVDAVASVMAQVRSGPHPGSALPNPDGYAPSSEFTVKANEGSKRYHDPDSPYYVRTRADLWFHSAEAAERAGFNPWNGRRAGR